MTGQATATTGAEAPYPIMRTGRQVRHLAQAVVLEEAGASRLVRLALVAASLTVVAFVIWAALTRLDERASAFGQVVPAGSVQQIQHLEGGIVEELLVEEGQMVEAGQVLARLSEVQARSELEMARAREAALRLRADRLRAIGTSQQPDFAGVEPAYADLAADQMAIFDMQTEAVAAEAAILESQVEQRQAEIAVIREQRQTLSGQIDLFKDELTLRQNLAEKGLGTRLEAMAAQRDLARLQGELRGLLSEEQAALERMSEVQRRLTDLHSARREAALNEMGEVTAELAQVRETLARLTDRVRRLDVVSPVRGLVQNMAVKTVGAVIPAGALVTEVVPVDDSLMVDVRISTRDVGHVQVGQPVQVKVTSYDFARFGSVKGRLDLISATTFLDEEKQPYYKGRVRIDTNYVGEKERPVLPGMTVQADIITGQKTLLEYLLKPIYLAFSDAFHER